MADRADALGHGLPKQAMTFPARRALAGLILFAPLFLSGCSRQKPIDRKDFVGKWKSSRMATAPIHLRDNGEWEIVKDDGTVLQYGVWQYKDSAILWSYKVDYQVGHDMNVVLSMAPREFKLREKDGSVTTFVRLE